jgi:hypothetical protein
LVTFAFTIAFAFGLVIALAFAFAAKHMVLQLAHHDRGRLCKFQLLIWASEIDITLTFHCWDKRFRVLNLICTRVLPTAKMHTHILCSGNAAEHVRLFTSPYDNNLRMYRYKQHSALCQIAKDPTSLLLFGGHLKASEATY